MRAVEDYGTQPALVAPAELPELRDLVGGDPAARLVGDLGTHMREAADQAPATHALLALDGPRLRV
ncbi:hypothetical protein ACWDZX_11460 [Streptomyces collinus]